MAHLAGGKLYMIEPLNVEKVRDDARPFETHNKRMKYREKTVYKST